MEKINEKQIDKDFEKLNGKVSEQQKRELGQFKLKGFNYEKMVIGVKNFYKVLIESTNTEHSFELAKLISSHLWTLKGVLHGYNYNKNMDIIKNYVKGSILASHKTFLSLLKNNKSVPEELYTKLKKI